MYELKPFEPVNFRLWLQCDLKREGNLLHAVYVITGDVETVRFSKRTSEPERKNDLWKKTCFELFVSPKGSPEYWEFNFSPSGDWNCYKFGDYRKGMEEEKRISAPQINFPVDTGTYRHHVVVDLSKIKLLEGDLDLSASAVIERVSGDFSYWATYHSGDKPDFHRRNSFILRLNQ